MKIADSANDEEFNLSLFNVFDDIYCQILRRIQCVGEGI